jgi:hypothetical protein
VSEFGLSFPEAVINRLCEVLEARQGRRFVVMSHVVFDPGWKPIVEVPTKFRVTPLNVGNQPVKIRQVRNNRLIVAHMEVLKLGFGLSYGIEWSKIGL